MNQLEIEILEYREHAGDEKPHSVLVDADPIISALIPFLPAGPQGIQGEQGLPGRDGRDGIDGTNGIDGSPGATGEKGDKGDPGERGETGSPGSLSNLEIFTGYTDSSGVRIIPIVDGLNKVAFISAVPPVIENGRVAADITSDTELRVEVIGDAPEQQKFNILVIAGVAATELE